jgi:hypothetical protein
MREDNLLCLGRRKFAITTDSNHQHRVYPNVAANLEVTGIDQLWVADITYIRLETEFIYLAVILDAHSRRVVGWALDRTLEASLVIAALRRALQERQPATGLVHHSDRGVQYACSDYRSIEAASDHHQHEPESQPIRQCSSGELHENVEVRGGVSTGIPQHGRSARLDRRVHRPDLQSETASLGVGIPVAGGVLARCLSKS